MDEIREPETYQTHALSGDRFGYFESRVVLGFNLQGRRNSTPPAEVQWSVVRAAISEAANVSAKSPRRTAYHSGRLRALFLGLPISRGTAAFEAVKNLEINLRTTPAKIASNFLTMVDAINCESHSTSIAHEPKTKKSARRRRMRATNGDES